MRIELVTSVMAPHAILKDKLLTRTLLVAIILNPLVFIWQGGDLTDPGFHALRAQTFFDDIHTDRIPADSILTNFMGGLWWQMFPDFGLFGFHVLSALIIILCSLVPFFTLRALRELPVPALTALLAGQALMVRTGLTFGYDLVSMLFEYMAVVFIYRGLERNKASSLFVAGILIAAAALARVPSILSLCLVILPLLWKEEAVAPHGSPGVARSSFFDPSALKRMALILSGTVAAFVVAAAIGQATGILHLYLEGLVDLYATTRPGGPHSTGSLLSRYFQEGFLTVRWLGLALLWILIAWFAFDGRAPRWAGILFTLVTGVALFMWITDPNAQGYYHPLKYLVLAIFGTCSVLIAVGVIRTTTAIRTLAVAGSMIMCVGFLGSNTGLLKAKNGLLLLVPICTVSVWHGGMKGQWGDVRKWKKIALVMAGLVFLSSFVARFEYVYDASKENPNRFAFTHGFETPLMYGIHSSTERVSFVDEIVPRIEETGQGRDLFVFGHMPALYFLTERKPFIKEVWLANNSCSAADIKQSLERRISEGAVLPVFVITNWEILGNDGAEMIKAFLTEHTYYRSFDRSDNNSMPFEIWTPS